MRQHFRSGSAAILSQAVVAGSSLILQWLALDQIGKSGLGIFAILTSGIVVTYNSVHTGFIGDALAVFDRYEPGIRRALFISSGASAVLSLAVGYFGALVFAQRSSASSALFAAALLAWTLEETGRRIMMARLEFWALVINDVIFAIGSLGVTAAVAILGHITIDWLIFSMLAGSTLSIVGAIFQLPREEFKVGERAPAELARLLEFSGWRAGQIGVRPLSQLVARIVVKSVTSTASLGLLETGRLIIAPIMTAANGLGVFLLPTFARKAKESDDFSPAWKIAGISGAIATAFGVAALVFSQPIAHALNKDLPAALVASWAIYSVAYCANIPIVNALVARRSSRTLFGGRLIDAVIGVALAYLLTIGFGVTAVPIGLAIGILVGTMLPVLLLVRSGDLGSPFLARFVGGQVSATESSRTGRLRTSRRRPNLTLPRLWPQIWVTVLPLAMIVGTEYKYRKRPLSSALGGSIDFAIILELAIYGLVGAYLALFVLAPPRWRRPTSVQFLLRAYAAMMVVSVAYGEYPQLGSVRAVQLIIMVAYTAAVANRATRRQVHVLAHSYLAMITISVFIGLIWRVPFSYLQVNRFNWMYVHSVIAAAMLALALVIGVAFIARPNAVGSGLPRWPRPLYVATTCICLAALIATETRGSLAGGVVGIGVVIFLTIPKRERLPVGIIGLVAVALPVIAFINPILTYLARGESTESLSTLSNRTALWEIAWDLVKERPFTGWGLTASRGVFFEKVNLGGAHNAVVNVVVDGGVIALLLWFGIIITIALALRRLSRYHDRDVALLAGLLANLMVNGMTTEGVGSGSGVSAIWLFIIAGWVGVLQREHAATRAARHAENIHLVNTHPPRPSRPSRPSRLPELAAAGRRSGEITVHRG